MADWANGEPQKVSQRRKWNLEDRSSLKNLKYQVAESGCSNSQYDLGRLLLLEATTTTAAEQSAAGDHSNTAATSAAVASDQAQGIQWLLRAAHQGHTDAVRLLAECYATRRGINAHNEYEVQAFLGQSSAERAARRAARELFACLSNGEHYITAAQLERKMRQIWHIEKGGRHGGTGSDSDDCDDGEPGGSGGGGSAHQGRLSRSPYRDGHRRRSRRRGDNDNDNTSDNDDNNSSDDCITEAHLVSAAINYSHGRLPAVSRALTLCTPAPHALDHIPCFHRLLFHPLTFVLLCYHRFVDAFARLSDSTAANLRLIAVLLLYTFLSSDSLATFAPLGAHYLSLGVMFASTLRILKARQEFRDFRMWSGLFLSYGDRGVDAAASENQFLRRRMQPYLWFFVAFCGNVMLTPLFLGGAGGGGSGGGGGGGGNVADGEVDGGGGDQRDVVDQWMAHSEVTVLAFILVFVTMLAPAGHTRPGPDWLLLVSFGVNVLAKYPYEMDDVVTSGWRFVDLKAPNFTSFVLGNGIEFCLSCRALLYLLIPGVLVLLARRRQWHGTYQYVIPHCVTLAWLQICIISSQCATWFGLVRAALALAGLMLFLPLFGIVTLMIPVFAAVEWLSLTDPTVRAVAFVVLAAGALAVSCCVASHRRTERYVTAAQVVLGVLATAFLALPYMLANFDGGLGGVKVHQRHDDLHNHHHHRHQHDQHHHQHHRYDGDGGDGEPLSWQQFHEYCQQPAWERLNRVRVQLRCAELDGLQVRWEGDISGVEIASVRNGRADFVHAWLPAAWADWVACVFGERNRVRCADGGDGASASERCDGIGDLLDEQKRCNLNAWATYEYALVVRMPGTAASLLRRPVAAEVGLRAAHVFGNFTQQLNATDRVWFRGVLRNNDGGTQATATTTTTSGGTPQMQSGAARWAMSLGGSRPQLELLAIGCVRCPNAPGLEAVELAPGGGEMRVNGRVRDLYRGVKYLLNVLFNPLVTFK